MNVSLSSGEWQVVGVPPFRKAAILAAHPLPEIPIVLIKRADGGFDEWQDIQDKGYRQERGRVLRKRQATLWEFYILESLKAEPPAAWRESEAWESLAWAGVKAREGERGLKLDWVEYELIQTDADREALEAAFLAANEPTPQDRAEAEDFFNVTWNGVPIRQAADALDVGKLQIGQGFAEFKAAQLWGFWPLTHRELTPELADRLAGALFYYDLPPRLRARLEVFVELDILADALRAHEAFKPRSSVNVNK